MRAGLRRHRITIQYTTSAQNTYGEASATWKNDVTVWGAIFPLRGNEYFANQQVQGAVTHKVTIQYRTLISGLRISPKCRIVYGSRNFGIKSVINPGERNIDLELMCVEEV